MSSKWVLHDFYVSSQWVSCELKFFTRRCVFRSLPCYLSLNTSQIVRFFLKVMHAKLTFYLKLSPNNKEICITAKGVFNFQFLCSVVWFLKVTAPCPNYSFTNSNHCSCYLWHTVQKKIRKPLRGIPTYSGHLLAAFPCIFGLILSTEFNRDLVGVF